MGNVVISADGLSSAIEKMLTESVEENDAILTKKIKKACNKSRSYLKQNSPVKTGGYASGWRVKVTGSFPYMVTGVVYQAKKPGLTHLLEKGHAKWLWGRPTGEYVKAIPHISPAYDEGKKELE